MHISTNRVRPLILGLGGTFRENSSSEKAMNVALRAAEKLGAQVFTFSSAKLALPLYNPEDPSRSHNSRELVSLFAQCDGIIVASPGYHGSISGTIKNALDYTEDLAGHGVSYFEGKPLGCIGCGAGWQGAVGALNTLRSIGHALRAWPTPMGVAVNTSDAPFDQSGVCVDRRLADQLELVGQQVMSFLSNNGRFRENQVDPVEHAAS